MKKQGYSTVQDVECRMYSTVSSTCAIMLGGVNLNGVPGAVPNTMINKLWVIKIWSRFPSDAFSLDFFGNNLISIVESVRE